MRSTLLLLLLISLFSLDHVSSNSIRSPEHLTANIKDGDEEPVPREELPPPSEGDSADGYLYLPEGQLVCVKRPAKAVTESPTDPADEATLRKAIIGEMFDSAVKKPLAIGCCPRGDPKGKVFRDGSSCCVNQIFNTSTHMCCPQKERVLVYSKESLHYCYGTTCLVDDLNLDTKVPMKSLCSYDKLGTPTRCHFTCPPGSQIRGTKVTKCASGTWTAHPHCCEGCPRASRYDVNFIVDLNADVGVGHQADVRSLIRMLVSYLPVSQSGVRVSVTSFNGEVMQDKRSWSLTEHNNHEELNKAIDNLQHSTKDSSRNAGIALQYASNHGFTATYGNRKHVDDVFVYIATGDPSDSVLESATFLKEKSNFVMITVGEAAHQTALSSIPVDHKIHIDSFASLNGHRKFLYEILCGSHCLTS